MTMESRSRVCLFLGILCMCISGIFNTLRVSALAEQIETVDYRLQAIEYVEAGRD